MMKGNLTRRGRSSWRLKFDIGRDPITGRRTTKFVTLRGTKGQAQAEAAKIMAAAVDGQHVDASRETVFQFVERWLRDWANDNCTNKTWTRYEQLLRKYLCARFGSVPIQKLRAADLQALYAAMAADGLADRTRLQLHRIVHVMLKHAAQWGVVPRNIAALVDAPRVKSQEIEILSHAQVKLVLETLRGEPFYPLVALALTGGLRRGELLGLRWADVDLNGGTLRVEQALEETTRAGLVFKAPKSRHGRRTITLPPSTIAVLREHWKTQQEQRLMLGVGKAPPDALVFANSDGSPYSPNLLSKQWRRAMTAAGLEATLHSLRHSHASALIASGLDVLTISRRLGHGSAALTLNVYGHLFKPDDRAAAIMEKAFGEPLA
jgi:integrase